MAKIQAPKNPKDLPLAVIRQMTVLATSGFGLVSALAWNNVIKEFIEQYVKPIVGGDSGMWSLLIYAVFITALAVVVTLQLTRIEQGLAGKKKK